MAEKIIRDDNEELLRTSQEQKKLERQYRIMERDKNSYAREMKCYLEKQRKIIETLTKEEANLKFKLEAEQADNSTCGRSNEEEKKFVELTKTYKKYMNSIEQKRSMITELDKRIADLKSDRKILMYYKDSKTTKMDESIVKSTKKVQQLEDKLYNETVKYDKLLADNATTRKAVDSLLKDKAKFDELYKKLMKKLNLDKKKLLTLIEQASIVCKQKDEEDEKLRSTLHREEQRTISEKHNMRELHRQLDHLINLKEFVSVKTQKRVLIDLEEKEMKKKQEKAEEIESYTRNLTSILEQLKKFCNEQDVNKLPELFIKQEEENYALFNYVNEINNEVQNLREQVRALEIELEEQEKLSRTERKEETKSLDSVKEELQEVEEEVLKK